MIYFVKTEESNFVKIGYSKGDVRNRVRKFQTGCPELLTIIHWERGGYKDETEYHKLFKNSHYRGEWFRMEPEISEYLREVWLTRDYMERAEKQGAELAKLRAYEDEVELEEYNHV